MIDKVFLISGNFAKIAGHLRKMKEILPIGGRNMAESRQNMKQGDLRRKTGAKKAPVHKVSALAYRYFKDGRRQLV